MSDRKNFRLSTSVRPDRYTFTVTPDLAAATFRGRGRVDFTVSEAQPALVLHGHTIDVRSAALDGKSVQVSAEAESQTLTFAAPLALGKHTLDVEWSGLVHRDLRGLYAAGGMGVTQFEAADARRVFPCADEPPFKAIWDLTVEAPAELAVVSNGAIVEEHILPDGKKSIHFAPTPLLSSYLVAFVVGKLVPSPAVNVRGVDVRSWAAPEKAALAGFAQECATAVLPLLEDYFATPYVFHKLDQIGVPDFEAGAMENAGCITFREILLLIDPSKTPLALVKRVAEVITHELAHQWFGNLVTMQWWDDLWLNEAFATWMAYKIVDQWRPAWRMWDDFAQGKAAALHLDAMASTHPIQAVVNNADEASENFDLITYEKGGAMLRMIEGYLGADKFRDGIRDYMKRHAWGNTVANDLWAALARASGQPVEAVANGWIGRPGYPLVSVEREGARLHFSQSRFFTDPELLRTASDAPWLVPLVVTWKDDAGVREARMLLEAGEGELTLPQAGAVQWVCANRSGAGFYRVRYSTVELAALARHRADLAPVERMGLLSDAAALFHAGAAPLTSLLELLVAFAADEDYAVHGEVVNLFDSIDRRLARAPDRPRLRRLIEELLAPELARMGWETSPDEKDDRRLRRAAALRGLALIARSMPVIAEAKSRLVATWDGGAPLEPNLLDSASIASARAGDVSLFERFERRARTETDPSEKRRALVSLASFEGPSLVDRAIALLDTDTVPLQDITIYMGGLLANPAARDKTWERMRSGWTALRARLAPSLLRRTVESLRELGHRRAEVEQFFVDNAESLSTVPAAVSQTRERLRLDEDARRRAEPELKAWLDARGL